MVFRPRVINLVYLLLACNRNDGQPAVSGESKSPATGAVVGTPKVPGADSALQDRPIPDSAALVTVFQILADSLVGDTILVELPAGRWSQREDSGPYRGRRVPTPYESEAEALFPGLVPAFEAGVFVSFRFTISERFEAFIARFRALPPEGQQVDLILYDHEHQRWEEPIPLRSYFGDAGDSEQMCSWLVDLDGDGARDILRRTDSASQDIEPGATDTARHEKHKIEVAYWRGQGFTDFAETSTPQLLEIFVRKP